MSTGQIKRLMILCKDQDSAACQKLARMCGRFGNWAPFLEAVFVANNIVPVPNDVMVEILRSLLNDSSQYTDQHKNATIGRMARRILTECDVADVFRAEYQNNKYAHNLTEAAIHRYSPRLRKFLRFFRRNTEKLTDSTSQAVSGAHIVESFDIELYGWNVPAHWSRFMTVDEDFGPVVMRLTFLIRGATPYILFRFIRGHRRSRTEVSALMQLGPKTHKLGSVPPPFRGSWVWSGKSMCKKEVGGMMSRAAKALQFMSSGLA
ncbi:MAG: hypothetical protein GF334_08805 [Candidatus Altiarchaeales archaeon]|nr:hypothetical protein [Candidatus Altiarchaeales archaeon]